MGGPQGGAAGGGPPASACWWPAFRNRADTFESSQSARGACAPAAALSWSGEAARSRMDFGEVRLDSSSLLRPHGERERRSRPPNDLPNDLPPAAGVRGGAGSSLSLCARVRNQRLACTSAIVRRVDGSTSSIPSRSAVRAGESLSSRRYRQRMDSTDELRFSSCARLSASKRGSLSLASSRGKMPSTRAKRHTPSDQTSACLPSYLRSRLAEITSGAAYELVPQTREHVSERGARPRPRPGSRAGPRQP
mmetsp:Transcript_5091/g.16549  ORF Transcript_5091/g.16549 Transcript_5091/m.16549 type:complete len:250 (+) Transcript_5091:1-750(+)